ncbi:ATP-binding protein [Streptomyces cyaneofuscatus]
MKTSAKPKTTGASSFSETLPCRPEAARRARLLVSTALTTWGLNSCTDAGTLIVSELIANAVTHTSCHLARVTIARTGDGAVRIAVADTSKLVPAVTVPTSDSVSGRGLSLVAALSDRWGYDLHRSSKVVWAELRVMPGRVEQ